MTEKPPYLTPRAAAAALLVLLSLPVLADDTAPPETQSECHAIPSLEPLPFVRQHQGIDAPQSRTDRIDVLVIDAYPGLNAARVASAFRVAASIFEEAGTGIDLRLLGIERAPDDVRAAAKQYRDSSPSTRLEAWGIASRVINTASRSQALDAIRREAGADLVTIFVPPPAEPELYGVGYMPGCPTCFRRSTGFSLFLRKPANVDVRGIGRVIAHEIGHNLGLVHQEGDREGTVPAWPYGRPYIGRFSGGRQFSTVMASPQVGSSLSVFSRDGFHDGTRVGDIDHDAARAIREAAKYVADYEDEQPNYQPPEPLPPPEPEPTPEPEPPCTPTDDVLHFDGGYRVRMCWSAPDGQTGQARAGIWASGQSGLLWFFSRDNAEVLVKVLDGCGHNGQRWVFVAPVTDLGFELRVTAPEGAVWTHTNPVGALAPTKSDLSAFPCSSGLP